MSGALYWLFSFVFFLLGAYAAMKSRYELATWAMSLAIYFKLMQHERERKE